MEKTSLREWSDGALANGALPQGASGTPVGGEDRACRPAGRAASAGRETAGPGNGAASRLAAYLRAIDL